MPSRRCRSLALPASLALLLVSCAGTAGVPRPAVAPSVEVQRWTGLWAGEDGHEYTYVMTLRVQPTGEVEGEIRWRLTRAPTGSQLATRIGASGTEYVRGAFDRGTRVFRFASVRVDDPSLLGLDEYRLVVAPDGRSLGGITRSGGSWASAMWGTRAR
jgi:hypothetical protein